MVHPNESEHNIAQLLCGKHWGAISRIDCEQSLSSSKILRKTQNKRGSVTVIVTALPLVARASLVSQPMPTLWAARSIGARPSRSHAFLFCVVPGPRIFEEKRDCSQSISRKPRNLFRPEKPLLVNRYFKTGVYTRPFFNEENLCSY